MAEPKRPKVLLVRPTGANGGGMMRVADYLVDADPNHLSVDFDAVDIRGNASVAAIPYFFIRGALHLLPSLRSGRVDVVHLFVGDKLSLIRKCAFARLAHAMGKPVLMHVHAWGLVSFIQSMPGPVQRWVRASFSIADRVAVLGPGAREIVVQELGVNPNKVSLLPNGIPNHFVERDNEEVVRDSRHLLFIGNLTPRKGLNYLLRAMVTAQALGPLQLSVAGGGDDTSYRALVQSLGLDAQVHFLGWLDAGKLRELMSRATALVLPSQDEALPLAVLEAMGNGLPVIATPVGELEAYLAAGRELIMVPHADVDALAAAIGTILGDPALARRLACAARETFACHFSMDAFLSSVDNLYQGCLDDDQRREGRVT